MLKIRNSSGFALIQTLKEPNFFLFMADQTSYELQKPDFLVHVYLCSSFIR